MKKSNLHRIILFSALLIGFGLRFVLLIQNRSFWWDESANFVQSQIPFKDLIMGNYYDFTTNPWLYRFILRILSLLNTSEIWLRFPSFLAGIFLIPVLYLISRMMVNNKVIASTVSFIYAFSTYHIFHSQIAKQGEIALLFQLTSFLFYIDFLQKKQSKFIIFHAIFLLLSILTSYYTIWYIFLLIQIELFVYWKRYIPRTDLRKMILAQVLILLTFSPWMIKLLFHLSDLFQLIQWISPIHLLDIIDGYTRFLEGEITYGYITQAFFIVIIPFFYLCDTISLNKKVLLLSWLFFPSFCSFLVSTIYKPIYHDWYVMFSSIPVYIILGIIVFSRKGKIISLGILIVYIIINLVNYQSILQDKKENWREAVKYIIEKQRLSAEDIIISEDPQHVDYYIRYRFQASKKPEVIWNKGNSTNTYISMGQIREYNGTHKKVCLVSIFAIPITDVPPDLAQKIISPIFEDSPQTICFQMDTR